MFNVEKKNQPIYLESISIAGIWVDQILTSDLFGLESSRS